MRPLRWGILGCGDIAGKTFAPCLVQSDCCELVAVMRRDAAKAREFAEQFGVERAYSDVGQLINDPQVDALVIATPPHVHAEQTVAAARAGKHVLVEKPMAMNPDECRTMIAACREAGVRLGVAYRRRQYPQVVKLKELLAEGAIGRVTLVRGHYSGWYEATPGEPAHWRLDPSIGGGGVLMDMACHRLEVSLNLGGRVTEVSAMVEAVEHDWPVEDSAVLLLRFESGALGVHSTVWTSPPRHDYVEVDGTQGKLILDPMECWADEVLIRRPEGDEIVKVSPLTGSTGDLPMLEDFVAAVRAGREPICGGWAGLHTQEVIAAAYESSRIGQVVSI